MTKNEISYYLDNWVIVNNEYKGLLIYNREYEFDVFLYKLIIKDDASNKEVLFKPDQINTITSDLSDHKQCGSIDKKLEKPPLGLRPKFVVDEQRRAEIIAAIKRYGEAGKAIPQEWIDEYNSLCGVLNG